MDSCIIFCWRSSGLSWWIWSISQWKAAPDCRFALFCWGRGRVVGSGSQTVLGKAFLLLWSSKPIRTGFNISEMPYLSCSSTALEALHVLTHAINNCSFLCVLSWFFYVQSKENQLQHLSIHFLEVDLDFNGLSPSQFTVLPAPLELLLKQKKPSADAHPCISSTCSREHSNANHLLLSVEHKGTFRNDGVLITKDCKGACDMCRHCWQLSSAARRTLPLVERYWNGFAVLLRHQHTTKWHQHPIIQRYCIDILYHIISYNHIISIIYNHTKILLKIHRQMKAKRIKPRLINPTNESKRGDPVTNAQPHRFPQQAIVPPRGIRIHNPPRGLTLYVKRMTSHEDGHIKDSQLWL